jgi:hypothetical protein
MVDDAHAHSRSNAQKRQKGGGGASSIELAIGRQAIRGVDNRGSVP